MRQLLADNQGLLNRIFDIVFDVGAGDDGDGDGAGVAAPVYITPSQLAERRAAEERRAAGVWEPQAETSEPTANPGPYLTTLSLLSRPCTGMLQLTDL